MNNTTRALLNNNKAAQKDTKKYLAVCFNMIEECKESATIEKENDNYEHVNTYEALLSFYFSEVELAKKTLVKIDIQRRAIEKLATLN